MLNWSSFIYYFNSNFLSIIFDTYFFLPFILLKIIYKINFFNFIFLFIIFNLYYFDCNILFGIIYKIRFFI
jgi:hypothetical protein